MKESGMGFGIKWGFIFGFLGIPVNLIMSTIVAGLLETIAESIEVNFWSFSFWVSITFLLTGIGFYLYFLFRKTEQANFALIILFLTCFAFLSTSMFYLFFAGRTDGQIGFALWMYPFKTALLYPFIGYFHELKTSYKDDQEDF